MKYAIWFKPGNEWVVNNDDEVKTFESYEKAEQYRILIDVLPPEKPNMEVRKYDNIQT